MSARCIIYLALISGCQSKTREVSEPAPIEVRDGSGATVATVRPGRPCRATIGASVLAVDGPPLAARGWSSEDRGNGITLVHDGAAVARVQAKGNRYDVFDSQGISLVRIFATDHDATVTNRASAVVRHARVQPALIAIDTPLLAITGTRDLVLAAVLTAPELPAEVRALAACQRVLGGS